MALNQLKISQLRRFQHLHPKTRFRLFKIFIVPILTFSGIRLLFNGHKSHKKVQTFQNRYIRQVHSIQWDDYIKNTTLHEDLNLPLTTHSRLFTNFKLNWMTEDNTSSIIWLLTLNLKRYTSILQSMYSDHKLPFFTTNISYSVTITLIKLSY